MKPYIALLRGINVGGHGILPMEELKTLCANMGFAQVRTYIQSGNVLFESNLPESKIVEALETELQIKLGKHIPVVLRTAAEMEVVLASNPFPDANPSQVGVLFLTHPVSDDCLKDFEYSGPEEIVVSQRELFIHYPNGMGRSKLILPKAFEEGTMRNINTIKKLVERSVKK